MRKPNAKCLWCNQPFYNRPSTPDRKTCSKECNLEARKAGYIKSGAEAKANCVCSICESPFYRSPKHQLRSKSGKLYCSITCQHADQKNRMEKKCLECEEPFSVIPAKYETSHYCSWKCTNTARSKWQDKREPINCETCGEEFLARPKSNRKFCSQKCMGPHISVQIRERMKNPEFMKNWFKSIQSPNKLEKFFDEFTPNAIKFTGNGAIWFTFKNGKLKNPDFVVDGTNKVIELHGDYWHRGEDVDALIENYKEVGYECLVLWESEIKHNWNDVLLEVLQFIETA